MILWFHLPCCPPPHTSAFNLMPPSTPINARCHCCRSVGWMSQFVFYAHAIIMLTSTFNCKMFHACTCDTHALSTDGSMKCDLHVYVHAKPHLQTRGQSTLTTNFHKSAVLQQMNDSQSRGRWEHAIDTMHAYLELSTTEHSRIYFQVSMQRFIRAV